MENCIEYFKEFLKNELKSFMNSKGFKTSGQHFFVENNAMIKFGSIEKSSWNTFNDFSFWFNISIFDKTAYNNLQEFKSISKVPHNTYFNIIKTSVSALKEGKPNTYYLNLKSDETEFSNLILDDLRNIVIPFIESINTKKELLDLYKIAKNKNGFIGAGIFKDLAIGFLEIENGNKEEGLTYIKNWIKKERERGYWTEMTFLLEDKIFNKNEV